MNKICLTGRIANDLELKITPNGAECCSFSVAVQRNHQKGGERITDFINCVAWRQTAVFLTTYFDKGKPIALTGRLETRKYTDKSGNNRVVYEVIVDNLEFNGPKSAYPADINPESAPRDDRFEEISDDDGDLPF